MVESADPPLQNLPAGQAGLRRASTLKRRAGMVKLANTPRSERDATRLEGSNPSPSTNRKNYDKKHRKQNVF